MRFKDRSLYNLLWGWHFGYLFAVIPTILGLLIAFFSGLHPFEYKIKGVLIFKVNGWLANVLDRQGSWAFTLGHVVLTNPHISVNRIRYVLPHELVHVHQYESYGPFFWLIYLVSFGFEKLRGHNALRTCTLEAAAYEKAKTYAVKYKDSTGVER